MVEEFNPYVTDDMDLLDLFQAITYDRSIEESTVSLREGADYLDIAEEELFELVESNRVPGLKDKKGLYRFTLRALDHFSGYKMYAQELRHIDEVGLKMAKAMLGYTSENYVRWLLQSGKIKARKLDRNNGEWRVRVDSIEKFLITRSRDKDKYPVTKDRHLYIAFFTEREAEKLIGQGYKITRRDFD